MIHVHIPYGSTAGVVCFECAFLTKYLVLKVTFQSRRTKYLVFEIISVPQCVYRASDMYVLAYP